MARADLLVLLIDAALRGDEAELRRVASSVVKEEREKQHHVLAERVERLLRQRQARNGQGREQRNGAPPERQAGSDLYYEVFPERTLDSMLLPELVARSIMEMVEEQSRQELLRSYALEPRHRVLLVGAPGTGKTSLAEAIATELALPLIVPSYHALVGSYLGETTSRLAKLFDQVRTRPCVLFFDEFDALGKERADVHETGEIKRVVSSLLVQIDQLPSYVVVVTATNHPDLLDRAVWRRFQLRLELPMPTRASRERWFERVQTQTGFDWGVKPSTIARRLAGLSFAELEDFTVDVRRRAALESPTDTRAVVKARLDQWAARYSPPSAQSEREEGDADA
ncbi:MAG: AAA family ATPase [Pseudomonadota bacterium]